MAEVSVDNVTKMVTMPVWSLRFVCITIWLGERGGSVVECRTPEREVGGSKPTAVVLCPWARHFTPQKYWLITQEAVAPSQHDWKIVDWDIKPQHKQTNYMYMIARECTIGFQMSDAGPCVPLVNVPSTQIELLYMIWDNSMDWGLLRKFFRNSCGSVISKKKEIKIKNEFL